MLMRCISLLPCAAGRTYSCRSRGKLGSTSSQSLRLKGELVVNMSVLCVGSMPKESVILGRSRRPDDAERNTQHVIVFDEW
jgi:hypothetical protein